MKTRVKAKPFRIGTTGWTASDLDDPRIDEKWHRGRFEIINGVLTKMPPAFFGGGECLNNLLSIVTPHVRRLRLGSFSVETDIIIDENRVLRCDACYLTSADRTKQLEAMKLQDRESLAGSRIYVAPTLVIEAMSPGHRTHDRVTKFAWYREFGVQNYWILDPYRKTLADNRLINGEYESAAMLKANDVFTPAMFPELSIPLVDIWPSEK